MFNKQFELFFGVDLEERFEYLQELIHRNCELISNNLAIRRIFESLGSSAGLILPIEKSLKNFRNSDLIFEF